MLVLTRKQGESIMIGDQIKIVICDVSGGRVRVGFEAPDDVMVYRGELYQSVQSEAVNQCLGMECYIPDDRVNDPIAATITNAYIDGNRVFVDIQLSDGTFRQRVPLSDVRLVEKSTLR